MGITHNMTTPRAHLVYMYSKAGFKEVLILTIVNMNVESLIVFF